MGKSSSSSEAGLLEKLEKKRLKEREKAERMKELMKATETLEEKRQRRLLKKQAKDRKRKEKMGWDESYMTYSNSDNPFGDSKLLQPFVWSKKLEKEGISEISREELEKRNRYKQEESRRELESVKKRREEREFQRQQREEEAALLQRGKEAAQLGQWHVQEKQFHLKQARLRAQIRIDEGRGKPIDFLMRYINTQNEVDEVEMHVPYTYLQGLTIKDLEDLFEDIKVQKELEKENLDYWRDLMIIVEDELNKLKKMVQPESQEGVIERREEISKTVLPDITNIIKGKTAAELEKLQSRIEEKINSNAPGVDIGYWESLLSQLKAHMARARLRDRHKENLQNKLTILKAEQNIAQTKNQASEKQSNQGASSEMDVEPEPSTSKVTTIDPEDSSSEEESDDESGSYSPKYIPQSELKSDITIILEEDDTKRLELARNQLLKTGRTKLQNVLSPKEQAMQQEVCKSMGVDGSLFSVEQSLEAQDYLWSEKYRPRKPRYFNRVHTGFEWNKYNQTHYDLDNPPPKTVQGYKFNIFYPDLIDNTITPEYFITPCPDSKDFSILRFKAGPPYEDIAFKIVNREWELSYKRGFRCQFHNNVFQLWFHFKRYRYRR